MQRNPDDHRHHEALLRALRLSVGQREELVQLYAELAKDHPRSMAVQRIPLDFLVSSLAAYHKLSKCSSQPALQRPACCKCVFHVLNRPYEQTLLQCF